VNYNNRKLVGAKYFFACPETYYFQEQAKFYRKCLLLASFSYASQTILASMNKLIHKQKEEPITYIRKQETVENLFSVPQVH
jgi:hypothetical protein